MTASDTSRLTAALLWYKRLAAALVCVLVSLLCVAADQVVRGKFTVVGEDGKDKQYLRAERLITLCRDNVSLLTSAKGKEVAEALAELDAIVARREIIVKWGAYRESLSTSWMPTEQFMARRIKRWWRPSATAAGGWKSRQPFRP